MQDHPFPEATYHDNYSDEENDGDGASEASSSGDEDEDDFVTKPREDSGPVNKKRRLSQRDDPPAPSNIAVSTSTPASTSAAPLPQPLPGPILEPSIINAEPLDEFIREIADWILRVASGRNNIEVEAKIGILTDSRTGVRLNLPVLCETILSPDYPDLRFESNVALAQHAHFNNLLNSLVSKTASSSHQHSRVQYAHTKLIDSFHSGPGSQKIRVTTDEKTGVVKECMAKTRIADLNVFSPKRKVDWRISVNAETPAPKPTTNATHTRRKDRITYTHQAFQIDLTQVMPSHSSTSKVDPSNPQGYLHELEVEFRDPRELMRLAAMRGGDGESGYGYDELVRVFVNNVHILVRNAL